MPPQNQPPKASFLTFAAIFLTMFMLFSWYNSRRNPPPEAVPAPPASAAAPSPDNPADAAAGTPATEEDLAFAAAEAMTIEVVRRPAAGPDDAAAEAGDADRHAGYIADFSTRGAALRRYRLANYRLAAESPEPVVLLDEVSTRAPGSLMLETFSASPHIAVGNQLEYDLSRVIYRLTRVPAGARRADADAGGAADWPGVAPENVGGDVLEMRARVRGFEIVRRFVFDAPESPRGRYGFSTEVEIVNRTPDSPYVSYRLWGPAGILPDDAGYYGRVELLSAQTGTPDGSDVGDVQRWELASVADEEGRQVAGDGASIAWAGAKNRFFAALLAAESPRGQVGGVYAAALATDPGGTWNPPAETRRMLADANAKIDGRPAVGGTYFTARRFESPLAPGESWKQSFRFYGGPADGAALAAADPRFDGVLKYTWSWFEPIARGMVWLLSFLHGLVGNYGVAIILLTIIIKTIMHPLAKKMYVSAQGMQRVAPLLKEIQRKYAGDRQKMGQEQMRVYRENHINPAGGCLPAFVQLPIFLALFGAFSQHFAVRQAAFIPVWIDDLSRPDSVWHLPWKVPVLGWQELSLLPIIYLAMQILQMRLQPRSPDPQVAQQQKIMMFMPVFFMFIFYTMPAGLVLYFTVSSLYSVVESSLLRRRYPPLTPAEATARAERSAAKVDAGGKARAGAGMGRGKRK